MGECVVYRDFAADYLAELVPLQVAELFLPFSLSLLYDTLSPFLSLRLARFIRLRLGTLSCSWMDQAPTL